MKGWHFRHARCWAALVMTVSVLGACQAPPETAEPRMTRSPGEVEPPSIAGPPLAPLSGAALEHARADLETALAELPTPAYLRDAEPRDDDPEPVLAAQRAYARGRDAHRRGERHEAIEHYEAALSHAPGQPAILRPLGELYASLGNRVRGLTHLRDAAAADPHDPRTLLLLGQFSLEQGAWEDAAALFGRALETRGDVQLVDELRPVIHYHLGEALAQLGRARAAIAQHWAYLDQTSPDSPGLMHRERQLMIDQRGLIYRAIGDLHHWLDEPAEALEAYYAAAEAGLPDPPRIGPRLAYTYLRLGKPAAAQRIVIQEIERTGGDERSLELASYLVDQGVTAGPLVAHLESLYESEPTEALVVLIASLLPEEQGGAWLAEHLERSPHDGAAARHYVEQFLLRAGAGEASPEALAEALTVMAGLIDAEPGDAARHARWLLRRAEDADALLAGFDDLEVESHAPLGTLRGLALIRAGQREAALEALEQVLDAAPDFELARLTLAELRIERRQFERAAELLEPLAERDEPGVIRLRVQVLAETGELDEALALLDRALERDGSAELVLYKARLQLRAGEPTAAERTLLDGLNQHPDSEPIYAALFELYSPSGPTAEHFDNIHQEWTRLVRRLLDEIPESRLARLVRAEILEARGRFNEAEQMLLQLLSENESDFEAVARLLELYRRANRHEQGIELLERKLQRHGDERYLLGLAHQFFREIGDMPRTADVFQRLLELEPESPARARSLALLRLEMDEPGEARDVLLAFLDDEAKAETIEDPTPLYRLLVRALVALDEADEAERRLAAAAQRFPDHAADLLYEHAMLAAREGDEAEMQRRLETLLAEHPSHADANNTLGYTWVRDDRNLERAREKIARALEADPENSAYLDSMGWAYYRQGDYEQAVAYLRRAREAEFGDHPIIIAHLGDALYQLDRVDEAMRQWREALALMEQHDYDTAGDPEFEGLDDRLRARLDAAEADEQPVLD